MRTLSIVLVLAACGDKQVDDSKLRKRAQLETKELAFESYPGWAARHSDKACPSSIADLAAGASETGLPPMATIDPWGNRYNMFCGKTLPAGERGLLAVSNGPDGKPGTADDIVSSTP